VIKPLQRFRISNIGRLRMNILVPGSTFLQFRQPPAEVPHNKYRQRPYRSEVRQNITRKESRTLWITGGMGVFAIYAVGSV